MKCNEFLKKSEKIVEDLLEILEVDVEELTFKEKELISAYSFGVITSMSKEYTVSEDEVYKTFKDILIKVLKYKEDQAEFIFKRIVKSNEENREEEFKIMIYQGKSIYLDYNNKNYNEVYDNLTNMIDVIVSKKYENY